MAESVRRFEEGYLGGGRTHAFDASGALDESMKPGNRGAVIVSSAIHRTRFGGELRQRLNRCAIGAFHSEDNCFKSLAFLTTSGGIRPFPRPRAQGARKLILGAFDTSRSIGCR